jgi:hypothetical protein
MMLRASTESFEITLIPEGLTDSTVDSGVPGAACLMELVEAVLLDSEEARTRARLRVCDEMGRAALIDAAGCIANFEMMNRVAEGTGMPVSDRVMEQTTAWRERLGI